MVKMVMVIGRRPDITHEAFLKHLSKNHLEVVDQVPEFRNRVRRYMQNHLFIDRTEIGASSRLPIQVNADGIIEVWFDSVDEIRQAFQLPRYLEIVRPDEHAFGDVEGAWGEVTDEVPVMAKEGFDGRIKLIAFVKRKTGMTHEQFLAAWHAVRSKSLAAGRASRLVGRFVENRVEQDPAEKLPNTRHYDLVAEMWFESLAALTEFSSDPEIAAAFLSTEFVEPASTLAYIAEEKPESAEWLRRSQTAA